MTYLHIARETRHNWYRRRNENTRGRFPDADEVNQPELFRSCSRGMCSKHPRCLRQDKLYIVGHLSPRVIAYESNSNAMHSLVNGILIQYPTVNHSHGKERYYTLCPTKNR